MCLLAYNFVAVNFVVLDSSDCPPSDLFLCIDAADSNVTECATPIDKDFDSSSDSDHNNVSG